MSVEALIEDSGQQALITCEAPDGQVPPQDALGGADRSDANWVTVASGVPCLVSPKSSKVNAFPGRNDARAGIVDAVIYFSTDPVPSGISSRHRITVTVPGTGGPQVVGVYAVQGSIDPNTMGRIFQVGCERVRVP